MQFKLVALSFFAAAATAQSVEELASQIPQCAQSCFSEAASQINCGATDYECQCRSAGDFTGASAVCIGLGCNTDDQTTATERYTQICGVALAGAGADVVSSVAADATRALSTVLSGATATSSPNPTSTQPGAAAHTGVGMGLMGVAAFAAMAL